MGKGIEQGPGPGGVEGSTEMNPEFDTSITGTSGQGDVQLSDSDVSAIGQIGQAIGSTAESGDSSDSGGNGDGGNGS
jgi:hypothetical protein